MSVESQQLTIEQAGSLGLPIPGLSPEPIIANLAEKSKEVKTHIDIIRQEQKDNEDSGMSKEEAKKDADKKVKDIIKKFKDSIKAMVMEQISIIKQQFKIVQDGITRIPIDVQAAIANIALPPSVSVPPGAPNPLYALNLALQTKNSLKGILGVMVSAFTTLLIAANMIMFILPPPVMALYGAIQTAAGIVGSIPG